MLVWDKEFADGKICLVDTASIIHYKYTHINFKYKLYSFGVLCHGYRQQKSITFLLILSIIKNGMYTIIYQYQQNLITNICVNTDSCI